MALLLVMGCLPLAAMDAHAETRSLKLYFVHTGEKAEIVFKRNGRFDQAGLQKINRFLRDWRRNEPTKMNPRLLDLVWGVYQATGSNNYINVVSAYRSPATNSMLRSRSKGVAKKSQHTLGNAMDFFIPGVPLKKLRDLGLKAQTGGVGYYPRSGSPFVHLDVGNVRHWPRMSRKELVAVFPNGKTLHVPSDGKPLPGFDQAMAAYQSRQKSGATTLALANDGGRRSKSLFAALFSRGADEEEESGPEEVVVASRPAKAPSAPVRGPEPVELPGVAPAAPVVERVPEVAPVPEVARAETIVAALPDRTAPLPAIAPRPKVEVAAAQPEQIPFQVVGSSDETVGAVASVEPTPATVEAALNVPLPTWRPNYVATKSGAEEAVLASLASDEATAPLPSLRPSEVLSEQAVTAASNEDSQQIASLIEASRPRDLAAERSVEQAPLTIVSVDSKTTKKAARATKRDKKAPAASIVLPTEPSDARWAFDEEYVTKGKGGNTAPSFAYNIVRTAPREVYANGFQPDGKELEARRFTGKAVAFLPVARFNTN